MGDLDRVCQGWLHPASSLLRLSAPAIPVALPVSLPFNRQTAPAHSPQPSPGHCQLLPLFSLPGTAWTGLGARYQPCYPSHVVSGLGGAFCAVWIKEQVGHGPMERNVQLLLHLEPLERGHLSHPALAMVLTSIPVSAGHVGTLVFHKLLTGCSPMLQRGDKRTSFNYYLSTLLEISLMLLVISVAIVPSFCIWVHSFFLFFFSRDWSLWTDETSWLAINSL